MIFSRIPCRIQKHLKSFGIVLLLGCALVGCRTRTIYVREGEPVRLRQTIKRAKVWAPNEKGIWVEGRMDLPEGWYCLPDPGATNMYGK
ncbi:MAG: hypothetical protein ABIH23_08275 [bacterium]